MKGIFENEHQEDSTTTSPENAVGSPLSGEEAAEESYMPSPKQSKRSTRKKVVTVPIGDGFRSKTDVYPPPDSCSWRKYGQKPIKGSPYPRGYYRCSSSKGCPAKKQVERSRHDPTTLLITYSCEHNHSLPNTTTATKSNHHHPAAASSSSTTTTTTPPANFSSEESATFTNQTDIEPDSFAELAGEFGWLNEVDSILIDDRTTLITPTWAHTDMEVVMPIGEEDELLFGDLGDLPESAVVFQHWHRMESCDPL